MKNTLKAVVLVLCAVFMVDGVSAKGLSQEGEGLSAADGADRAKQENRERTRKLIQHVEGYLKDNDTYVGIIARRGAGDPKTGVSDTDTLDVSGMAHCGFVVRNGLGKNAGYVTYNLVRIKDGKQQGRKKLDISELRIWSLPQFFIGAFEKDAIVFLPEKKVQLKLWNLLRANGQLNITTRDDLVKDGQGKVIKDEAGKPRKITRHIITNGAFVTLHNQEYNLLSDYVDSATQNCNEHLLKTYIGVRDYWQSNAGMQPQAVEQLRKQTQKAIEDNYIPRQMILSRTKSTFAFTQNIRFGERYKPSPALFGLKLSKEKFDVVSVDSFCDPKNQRFLRWHDFKVFREGKQKDKGLVIEDWGKDYVKVNRFTGKKNRIVEL